MKEIINKFTVYNISELSEAAKQKAINDYKNDEFVLQVNNDIFYQDIIEELKHIFNNSCLDVCYSLGYCQGDGLYIYGDINYMDGLEKVKDNFTNKEIKTLKHYISESKGFSSLYNPHQYYYFNTDRNIDNIAYDLKENIWNYRNINEKLIYKYSELLCSLLEKMSANYEEQGYKQLYYAYDGADQEIIEIFNDNEYMFFEDGTIYY